MQIFKNAFRSGMLLSLVFLGFSCNNENEFENGTPPPATKPIKIRTDTLLVFEENKFPYDTIFGRGYDITEDLFGDQLFKGKVIDFKKYVDYSPYNYYRINHHKTFASTAVSSTIPNLLEEIMVIEKMVANQTNRLKELLGVNQPFMKSFKGEGDWEEKTLSYRVKKITKKRIYLGRPFDYIKEYLSSEFEKDVEQCTAMELIKKYGTHVPTEIITGGNIKMLLGAKFGSGQLEQSKINMIKSGSFYKGIKFGIPMDYDSTYELNIDNYNRFSEDEYLKIKSIGGSYNVDAQFAADAYNALPKDDYIWGDDIEDLTMSTCTEIRWDTCYPLYEFINEESKKEAVKKAIIQYIADSNK